MKEQIKSHETRLKQLQNILQMQEKINNELKELVVDLQIDVCKIKELYTPPKQGVVKVLKNFFSKFGERKENKNGK